MIRRNRNLMMIAPMTLLSFVLTLSMMGLATAFQSPMDLPLTPNGKPAVDRLRQEWINRSVDYYSKVMREERRRNRGQLRPEELEQSEEYQKEYLRLAKVHYFALRKIKDGQHHHAEQIYRRIIDDIMSEEEDGHCDHAKLAVTTLLLALHCQRMGDLKKTRSVFLNFFRVVVVDDGDYNTECACSAKVLGAYALFEMKQGNVFKSLEIARKAVQYDPALEPVLSWKQFREAEQRRASRS